MLTLQVKPNVGFFGFNMSNGCPNRGFLSALEAAIEQTEAKSEAKLWKRLRKCRESLLLYPLQLPSAEHCKILDGFNAEIVEILLKNLKKPASDKNFLDLSLSPIKNPPSDDVDPDPDLQLAMKLSRESYNDEKSLRKSLSFSPPKAKKVKHVDDVIDLDSDSDSKQDPGDKLINNGVIDLDDDSDNAKEDPVDLDLKIDSDEDDEVNRKKKQEEEDFKLALALNEENFDQETAPQASNSEPILSDTINALFNDSSMSQTPKKSPRRARLKNVFFQDESCEFHPRPSTSKSPSNPRPSTSKSPSNPRPSTSKGIPEDVEIPKSRGIHAISSSDSDNNETLPQKKTPKAKSKVKSPSKSPYTYVRRGPSTMNDVFLQDPVFSFNRKANKVVNKPGKKSKSGGDDSDDGIPVVKKRGGRKKETGSSKVITEDEIPDWVKEFKAKCALEERNKVTSDQHESEFSLNDFEVILIVDNMEVVGATTGKKKNQKAETLAGLSKLGVKFEQRHLNVSDFAWIAKEKNPGFGIKSRELMLPYVLERKRIDDLRSSIMDGRYREQKGRLSECGIPHIVYLVEDFDKQKRFWCRNPEQGQRGFHMKALQTAIISTAAVNKFIVKTTKSHKDTIQYLADVTKHLEVKYNGKLIQ